ncbi:MAG: hypothetical protein KDC46_02430 [Thermoleophilia bacterium]|nr:hypothetical protein [Thermoleophilia bacterium]
MPDPAHFEHWEDLRPWLVELGLDGAVPVRRLTNEHGAYSPAGRWIVELDDGERRFVKAMRARAVGRHGVENEHRALELLGVPWVAQIHAWRAGSEQHETPSVLVVEDLSDAAWGAPLDQARADGLRRTLDHVATVTPPGDLATLTAQEPFRGCGWPRLLERSRAIVELGVVDQAWIDEHGPALADAATQVDCSGSGLVHGDLWLQNWCSRGEHAVLVDWTGASIGNPRLNHAWGECGVRAAGGPAGRVLAPTEPDHDAWAAWMSGLACSFVAFDDFDRAEHHNLHLTQLREACASIRWACEAHALPAPASLAAVEARAGAWRP